MNTDLPLVCICVPTYNAAGTVRETLESILAQTYPRLVIHVSDNASTDETLKIIESIGDRRITIHRHDENVGGEGNFNRCINYAEGKYTAIFHADDLYRPEIVARQVAFLESHPDAGAVFAEATLIDEVGAIIGEIRLPKHIDSPNGLYGFPQIFKAVLRHANFFICPSAMVHTQVYQEEIKCWRGELFNTSADLDLWFRILQLHPVGFLRERLMCYRYSNSQWSARVRMETDRADFFLVISHYLAQKSVCALIDATDLRNFRRLERRDRVVRACNLFITGNPDKANDLVHDAFSLDTFEAAFDSKRGAFVLLAGLYIKLLVLLRLNKIGKISLLYMKQITRT